MFSKLKSFGLIESIIGATIMVLILTAAVTLSSAASKSARLNSAYFEAGHIAGKLFSGIEGAKASGKIYFDDRQPSTVPTDYFSINCFSFDYISDPICNPGLPYLPYSSSDSFDADGYNNVLASELHNPAFSDGSKSRFSWKISVKKPEQMLPPKSGCGRVGSTDIPSGKCRYVETDVKWQEPTGEKHYEINRLFTDWER